MSKYVILFDLSAATYEVEVTQSDIPVEGNAMASGDSEFDSKVEEDIKKELDNGNTYAWCDILVKAKLNGLEGSDSLGAVSVKNEEELENLIAEHDMRNNALAELEQQVKELGATKDDMYNLGHTDGCAETQAYVHFDVLHSGMESIKNLHNWTSIKFGQEVADRVFPLEKEE